ncbi:MAG: DUF1570 domain-containing protein [Planctomycetes bacterium]|nr:DUF1570 domain-containing protein [Planctomycetota bacterium]
MRSCLPALVFLGLPLALVSAETPAAVDAGAVRKWLLAEHGKLAASCKADGLVEEACDEYRMMLLANPASAEAKKGLATAGRLWVTHWDEALHSKFKAYRADRKTLDAAAAEKFVALATRASAAKSAEAFIKRALEYDPDCKEAREKAGQAFVEGCGWVSKAEAEKRAQGLLPIGGQWLPAKDVVERRKKWAEAWVVKGEHFEVTSNHSLEGATDLLARAEEMYGALMREFSGVVAPPKLDAPMKIAYFATRADLDEHDRAAHPGRPYLTSWPGFFLADDKLCHICPMAPHVITTIQDTVRHEGCHQVTYFMIPAIGDYTQRPCYWVIEGLAAYFETTEVRDGKILVGSPTHLRIRTAREEMAAGKAVPLVELFRMNQSSTQPWYPQAAGVVHFFLNAADGKYHKAFCEFYRIVQEGTAGEDTFQKAFGRGPETFEKEWREWIAGLK